MGIKESIQFKSLKVKRRLFDEDIKRKGRSIQVVKLAVEEEDIFHDSTTSVIEAPPISAVIVFPDKVPLDRFRFDGASEVSETRTFFFEILPIECYTKISDHVETNDILVFALNDENENSIPFVLQVTESFGKFEVGLVWKMQYLSPVNGDLSAETREFISDFFQGG